MGVIKQQTIEHKLERTFEKKKDNHDIIIAGDLPEKQDKQVTNKTIQTFDKVLLFETGG